MGVVINVRPSGMLHLGRGVVEVYGFRVTGSGLRAKISRVQGFGFKGLTS